MTDVKNITDLYAENVGARLPVPPHAGTESIGYLRTVSDFSRELLFQSPRVKARIRPQYGLGNGIVWYAEVLVDDYRDIYEELPAVFSSPIVAAQAAHFA